MPDSSTVEAILDWAEDCISYHHNQEDFKTCLAVAQEFHEWFTTKNGDDYHIYYYPNFQQP